ncbi:MAG: prolyl oligopeptidase family serine peptidase [Acidimicrobiales bacterium]
MTDRQRNRSQSIDEFPGRYAKTGRFSLGTPRTIRVIDRGRRVLFCRSKSGDDAVLCLWSLSTESGEEHLVVDPAALTIDDTNLPPAERARRERARESASGIVAFSVDAAGRRCCFALGGELFVVDLADETVTSPETDGVVFDPHLRADGTAVAYHSAGALRLCTLDPDSRAGGASGDRTLRDDNDPLISFGRAEFVAAEEMGRSRGFWWSPEGTSLLATRVDEQPVRELWIADPAHPERPPTSVRYPAAGTANASVALELVDIDGNHRSIDWSDGGRYEYLADVVWEADRDPLIVRQTRDQRTVSIAQLTLGGDAEPDRFAERATITDDVWVELHPGSPAWSPAGLLTIEDRDTVRGLFLDREPIGPTGLQIRSIVGVVAAVEAETSAVVVTAWTDPTEIHVFSLPLDGGGLCGETEQLSSDAGVNGAVLGGSTIVVTSAGPDKAGSQTSVHELAADGLAPGDGHPIADHSADPGFAAEPHFVALGRSELPAAVFLPTDHDSTTPLPVLLDPYGGPHAQRVLKTHNGHLPSRWFAEQGYAVVVADGRGTPGRGPAWERTVSGDLANPVLEDQLEALDAALDMYDELDGNRVAIRGWSFGGYLAALAVLRRPDRFHAAIAGAPVTRWGLYDTHYTERYLGHPDQHPEHYARSDLWVDGPAGPELAKLERPMLLIHGLADDNVVAAHTLRFSTALLATGSAHQVLPLSGVTHMTPQVAVAENLLRLQLEFLDRTVGT